MGLRLVCLASGRGSNFAALCAAGRAGQLGGAQVVGLVVNRPGCGALDHAQRDAVPTAVVDHTTASDRADFEAQLLQAIEPMNPDGSKFGAVKDVTRERAVVDEKCPKCAHKGLNFYTMQLRSVDEGQTVFYECPKCGHTFSQNN